MRAHVERLVQREAPFGQTLAQSATFDELRDDEAAAFRFADFVDGEYVRVVEGGCGACLLLEASHALVVAREVRGQEFERDSPTEARVLRQVDRAHSALAQFFEN